jgi:hypothetical protein
MALVVTLIANIIAAGDLDSDPAGASELLAWSFGLTTLGFGVIKLGIAVALVAIIYRLWTRVESVKVALARLKPDSPDPSPKAGVVKTLHGPATEGLDIPRGLPIHAMAKRLWAPMVVMGAMALGAGFVVSLIQSGEAAGTETFRQLAAWTQGLQFLGEGLILAGIAFLLGSILASLRAGGGEVQKHLGVTVRTLKMPITAKVFVVLMMMGTMLAVAQFVLYVFVAGSVADSPDAFAAWLAWLGPVRELAVATLLASIVLALVTIGNVLGFQFDRIREIIRTGA